MRSRKFSRRGRLTGVLVGAAVVSMAATAAPLHAATIDNSDFEGDTVGSAPSGWTVVGQKIDLGVSSIAGCRTVDTSTYGNLRNFYDEVEFPDYGTNSNSDPHPNLNVAPDDLFAVFFDGQSTQATIGGQLLWQNDSTGDRYLGAATATDVSEMTLFRWRDADTATKDDVLSGTGLLPTDRRDDDPGTYLDDEDLPPGGYSVTVVDGSAIEDFVDEEGDGSTYSYTRVGKVLELRSETSSEGEDGYVMHGPAVYSEEFESGPGRQLSLWWAASGEVDDFHVFGYLLNVDTCEQTEVLDATGIAGAWQRARASVTKKGTYRFVFVSGTYDQTWGGAGGALLWIDDITEEVDEDPSTPTGPTLTNAGTDTTVALFGVMLVLLGAGAMRLRRRHA